MPPPVTRIDELAQLLRERALIDARIAQLIGRPALPGHIGEFIASEIFGIALNDSASAAAHDGTFVGGPLAGRSVNIKLYGKNEGLLDLPRDGAPNADYTLVLVGPRSPAASSKGTTRPIVVSAAYLFRNDELLAALRLRGVKIGVATSLARSLWEAAEIYPRSAEARFALDEGQRDLLALLAPERQLA